MKARLAALLLFFGLVVVYNANYTVLDEGDAVPTVNLPLAILQTGKLSFEPEVHPELFKWKSKQPFVELDDFFLVDWRRRFGGKAANEWRREGYLTFNGPRYYIVEAPHRKAYVSTFGLVPALVALPLIAPFYAFDHELAYKLALKTAVAKVGSSALVACTAVLLFLIAIERISLWRALLLALLYAVATPAWAVSSQNLWQQTVNQWWLALGAYFFLVGARTNFRLALAGFCLGGAAACRAPCALAAAAVVVHLYFSEDRRRIPWFVLGAAPLPLLVLGYNQYFFGNPFAIAQEMVGHVVAQEKTGSPELWQTPFFKGLAGLLVSPSRGLLVFSPLLGLAFLGVYRIWRNPAYADLRPLTVAALFPMALQCKWFDWWGGWTFGYRPWLDAVPYLTLFLLPVVDDVLATRGRQALAALAFSWSVFVQGLGALAYDHSWNLRQIFVVRRPDRASPEAYLTEPEALRTAALTGGTYLGPSLCNVDFAFCRYRLWSLSDNIILYHLTDFRITRSRRLPSHWEQFGQKY